MLGVNAWTDWTQLPAFDDFFKIPCFLQLSRNLRPIRQMRQLNAKARAIQLIKTVM